MIGYFGASEITYAVAGLLFAIPWIYMLIPILSVTVRRLHELRYSGWWAFPCVVLFALPVANLFFMVLLMFVLPGRHSENSGQLNKSVG